MKTSIKTSAEKIFRNKEAISLYNEKSTNGNVYEYGVDSHGDVYFAWLNGNIERYTRKQFISLAKKYYQKENES